MVPYSTCESAGSLVVQEITAPVGLGFALIALREGGTVSIPRRLTEN